MKKLLLLSLSILVLTACSKTAALNDAKVLYSIGGKNTSEDDFYQSMKNGDDGTVVLNAIRPQILDSLDLDKETVEKMVNENIASLEEMFKDKLEDYVKSFGYASVQDFIDKQVRPSILLELSAKQALEAQSETLISTYKVKDIEYIASAKKEMIEDYLGQLESTPMSELELDDSTKYTSQLTSKSNEIASKTLKAYLDKDQETGMSEILFDQESNLYFLVNNREITDLSIAIDKVIKDENFVNQHSAQLFKENGFEVIDKDLKNKMKKSFPDYIK